MYWKNSKYNWKLWPWNQNRTINILLYADDIVLFAKKFSEMQRMIELVETFGDTLEVKFNLSKTSYMVINGHLKQNTQSGHGNLTMNNMNIDLVTTM